VLAGQRGEPQQAERARRLRRRDRRCPRVLAARDQLLVVGGGREEAAALGSAKRSRIVSASARASANQRGVERRLVERQQRLEQERVVLEYARSSRRPRL
jgi:hypothetical protein